MFQYREVLARLRAGDADREVARSGLMGRQKVAASDPERARRRRGAARARGT